MDWRDKLAKKHSLNKVAEQQEAVAELRQLKFELLQKFSTAVQELKDAQTFLGKAGKILSLQQQGNHFTLNNQKYSIEIKMKKDEMGFELLEDGKVVDEVSIFVHEGIIVHNAMKGAIHAKPVDIKSVMGNLIEQLDTRLS